MDRTSSNPMFGNRGAAPIPEEYQKKTPKAPPRPPSALPPPDDDSKAHEAFELARQDAARKREAVKGRPLSYRFFLPRMSSSKSHKDEPVDGLDSLEDAPKKNLPRLPSQPPPDNISDMDHEEFERRQKAAAEAKRKKKISRRLIKPPSKPYQEIDEEAHKQWEAYREQASRKHGITTPLHRAATLGHAFFSDAPPPLQATAGDDDGEKIDAKPEPKLVFKSRRERCIYEIRHRHALERAFMAGFAVCLLWLTSLSVAHAIVNSAIFGPSLNAVFQKASVAINRTDLESNSYVTCAKRRAADCNRSFTIDLIGEVGRVNANLTDNRAELDDSIDRRGICSSKFGDVVLTLDYLVNVMGEDLEPTYTIPQNLSNTAECVNVQKILVDQLAAIRAQLQAEVFKAQADEAVNNVHDQFRARVRYDAEYLANNTIGLLLSGEDLNTFVTDPRTFFANMSVYRHRMMACSVESGVYGGENCQNLPTLMQKVNNARAQLIADYENKRQATNTIIENAKQDYAPLFNFYNTFKGAMERVSGLKAALDGTANNNGGNGGGLEAFGWVDINPEIGSVSLPSGGTFGNYLGSTAAAGSVNQQNQQRMDAETAATEQQMVSDAETTKEAHMSWQASFYSDYNPPPYDVEAEAAAWAKTTGAYLPDVQDDLTLVARRVTPPRADAFRPSSNSSLSGRTAQQLLNNTKVTPLELYSYENIDPFGMVSTWNTITNLALAMDYVYRILRSISIIKTYWNVSAVMAPPADVRVGKVAKGVAVKVRRNPDQALAHLLTHPAVNLLLILIFLGLASGLFLGIYSPFFDAYRQECVEANAEGQGFKDHGTVVSGNLKVIAINTASGDGDAVTATAIDQINVERELQCSTNEDLTFRQQRLYRQEQDFEKRKVDELMDSIEAFRSCIDTIKIDEFLGPANVSLATNGSTSSVHASLQDINCVRTYPVVKDVVFECERIRVCNPECTGIAAAEVNKTVYDAGCIGEYYLHAGVLGTFFSLLAFILMNLSRWTFLRGLRRMLMDHFAIGEYSYLATTNEHGETEYPEKVTQEGESFRDVLRDELHLTLKKYKRSGIYICIIALLLNVPWIVGLNEFSRNLQFQGIGNNF